MGLQTGGNNNVPFRPGGVILAAGESRRMGSPKAFLPFGATSFLGEVLAAARSSSLQPMILVTNELLRPAMETAAPEARILINDDPSRGQLSSLQIALGSLQGDATPGAVLFLLDHPGGLEKRVEILLGAAKRNPDRIHIAAWKGKPGHPVYLPREDWEGLLNWQGPEGTRGYLKTRQDRIDLVETGVPETLRDIDTPQEYKGMTGLP
ncbi:MAG: nucleotidyltransferase family protein [Candidatus Sumerlaeia bacterium]|nr:nucleotidyltransferase family protein [Candidatus Sumerlaeia bacterium]